MLFTKKTRFSVTEKQIKEDICDQNGETVLKINLRYPEIKCDKRDPLLRDAVKFYPRFAEEFASCARNEFKKAALTSKEANSEGFVPFSALMNWENAFENEEYLCIVIDVSVSDGLFYLSSERKIQIWERAYGTKCRFSYFFKPDAHKKIIEEFIKPENKKSFDRELFALRENGYEFHLRCSSGHYTYLIPYSVSEELNLTKIKVV